MPLLLSAFSAAMGAQVMRSAPVRCESGQRIAWGRGDRHHPRMADQLPLITADTLARRDAIARLAPFMGRDLRGLAASYGITVWRDGRRNKGWAGQTVERLLGMAINSEQAADFGDWELKVVPLVPAVQTGGWRLKESMAITMFSAADLETQTFEESHLWAKLQRVLVVGRSFEGPGETRSILLGAAPFDL
ncbi:MAG: DNA mismatch repair protein MutH, partial [Bradymonadia bacterium]